jgi:vacuolar-type H+-ATPase subunit E/Vma4
MVIKMSKKEEEHCESFSEEALNRLLKKIQDETTKEVKQIQKETKKKLADISTETQRLVDDIKKRELAKEKSRIEFLRKRTETEYEQEARKIEIQTRENLIDDVYERLEIAIKDFRKNKDYEAYLRKTLTRNVRNMREKKVKVIIDKRDETIFKKIVAEIVKKEGIECEIDSSSLKTEGGFIITDQKERVRISQTLENLLETSRDKIRTRINELLFEEVI